MNKLEKIYLLTGSNIGDREQQLMKVAQLLNENTGEVTAQSSIYETEAWGLTDQPDFLNQALELITPLSPQQLIESILNIERKMGRVRSEKWTARLIDIDVIFYGSQIIKTETLTIPHPFMHERNFVLVPLMEIAADFIHPVFKLSVKELYERSEDKLEVKTFHAL